MPSYTLQLELLGNYLVDQPGFEIWADGVLDSSYSISSAGSSITATFSYGGALPSSLQFRFNDALPETGRFIEIQSVSINNRVVNKGNYLSSDNLVNGGNSNVNIAGADFIFNNSADPLASEFTVGATNTFTSGRDTFRDYNGTTDRVFDLLGDNDYAHTGSGDDKIAGGAGNDTIRSGAGNDLVFGGIGNDRIFGMDGDDTLHGGSGDDAIQGHGGNDEIHGGDGDDRLNGQDGDDIITGGLGSDKITGGSGSDALYGDNGDDQITGGLGDDTVDGGGGNDLIYGGLGVDYIDGGDDDDIIIGDQGNDILKGGDGNDIIYGKYDDDLMYGGDGDDRLFGGTEEDTIYGGAGNDILLGGASRIINTTSFISYGGSQDGGGTVNQFSGGAELDGNNWKRLLVNYTVTADTVLEFEFKSTIEAEVTGIGFNNTNNIDSTRTFELYGTQTWGIQAFNDYDGSGDWTHYKINVGAFYTGSFTHLIFANDDDGNSPANGTDGNSSWMNITLYENTITDEVDILDGGLGNDQIIANKGDDIINGGSGDDVISGQDGDDVIDGGSNNDIIHGGDGNDTILGGGGNDEVYGNNGDDSIFDGAGNDIVDGGAGIDTLDYSTHTTYVRVDLSDLTAQNTRAGIDTISNIENLIGTSSNDDLAGDVGTNIIQGGAGTDEIWGNGGADFLYGGDGTDYFWVQGDDAYDDLFDGGAGTADYISFLADANFHLATTIVNVERIDMNGFDAYALLNDGLDFTGMLVYARGDIFGQTGNETITGSNSSDYIYGLAGNDTLNGGIGNDYIYGGDDNDIINGGVGNDRLYGDAGVDTINGGLNDDYIYGGEGADILNGDERNDDFWYTGTESYGDTIDGGADYDEIQLSTDAYFNLAFTHSNIERFDMNGFNAIALLNDGMDFSGMVVTARGDFLGQGGNETITGTESTDDIYGLAGNDVLNGGGGNDYIYGGDDNDTLNGGTGADRLYGEAGNDTLNGGDTADYLYGGAGVDIINGDDGNDDIFITGAEGIGDTHDGGAGTDDIQLQSDVTFDLTTTFTNMETLRFNGFNVTAVSGNGFDLSDMNRSGTGLLLGTALGAETITGTSSADTIYGYAGNDTLNGFIGSDTIYAGDGDDTVNGGTGNDVIRGEAGNDILNGDDGTDSFYVSGTDGVADVIDGGAGTDYFRLESNIFLGNSASFINMERVYFNGFNITAVLNEGFDLSDMSRSGTGSLYGQGGSETITGTSSNDIIYGLEGADVLNGFNGNDDFMVGGTEALGDIYDGGVGTDDIRLTSNTSFNSANSFTSIERLYFLGSDVNIVSGNTVDFGGIARGDGGIVYGDAGNETITGFTNGSTIYGYAGDDIINSGEGSDNVYGGAGADIINGGTGNDNFSIGGTEAIGDTYDGGDGSDDFYLTSNVQVDSTLTFTNMERMVFGGFNITVNNNATFNLTGLTASGTSRIYDSTGNETIHGTESGDNLYSGDGSDILHGNAGNDNFWVSGTGGENEEYYGGTGSNYLRLESAMTYGSLTVFNNITTLYNYNFDISLVAGSTIDFSGMNESGNGFVIGTASVETIIGFNTADAIRAGGGADIISTGNGNDSIYVSGTDALGDILDGGAGTDYFRLEGDTTINSANTFTNMETIIFGGHTLIIDTGSTVDLSHMLRSGTATIEGMAGNETITGINNGNYIYGFDGDDTLTGGATRDYLYGGNNNDILTGAAGSDLLYGEAGDDILYGGDGLDYLYGDAGADTFIFENAFAFNDVDRVYGFVLGDNDKIDITDLLSGYTFGTDDITDFVQIRNSGANSILEVDTAGTGSFTGNQIATIYAATGLTDELALETSGNLITH